MNRVIRACIELGDKNIICSIHDQGAGGNGNVLKEICEPAGAVIKTKVRLQVSVTIYSLLKPHAMSSFAEFRDWRPHPVSDGALGSRISRELRSPD